jgi:hypothetical protein
MSCEVGTEPAVSMKCWGTVEWSNIYCPRVVLSSIELVSNYLILYCVEYYLILCRYRILYCVAY